MGVWASTEVDRIDLKRDVEEVSLGMTRYSSHYLPAEVKTEHDELNNSILWFKAQHEAFYNAKIEKFYTRLTANTITCCFFKKSI